MASKYFKKALAETSPESKQYIKKNLDITEQILHLLEEKALSQKALAKKLGKTEAEVSRMLSGFHNFTLKSLTKFEVALEEDIVTTPLQQSRLESSLFEGGRVISIAKRREKDSSFDYKSSSQQLFSANFQDLDFEKNGTKRKEVEVA